MKKIRKEVIEARQKYWKSATLTSVWTFLSSKLAGVNPNKEIHVGKNEDEKFLQEFLVENGKYYNPCTNNIPRNQSDYFRTIGQYRHKWREAYSEAFEPCFVGY